MYPYIKGRQPSRLVIKKGISFLTLLFFSAQTLAAAAQTLPSISAPPIHFVNPDRIEIPSHLGTIQSQFKASDDKPLIIYVQDAHAVLDAQKNIEKLIRFCQEQYGVTLIGVEGGKGRLDPTLFRAFPDMLAKKKVMNEYLKRGELGGAEMAAIFPATHDAKSSIDARPIQAEFFGIENWELYEKNYAAYVAARTADKDLKEKLSDVQSALDKQRGSIYSTALNEYHQQIEGLYSEKNQLYEFLRYIGRANAAQPIVAITSEKFPHLKPLLDSVSNEAGKDQSAIDVSIKQMAEMFRKKMSTRLDKDKLMEFNRRYQTYLVGGIDPGDFLRFMVDSARTAGLNAKLTPYMQQLLGQAETLSMIKGTQLFDEIEKLNTEWENALAVGPEQKALALKYHRLRLLKNLISLELNRDEWNSLTQDPETYLSMLEDKRDKIQPALRFYQGAMERDGMFIANLNQNLKKTKARAAMVLTGGFHAKGFEERLKHEGYSYAIVTPKISSLEGQETYNDVMQGKLSYKQFLRTTYYDAFVRHSTMQLVNALNEPDFKKDLKIWRDEVIRSLANEGRVAEAGKYTRYIDLLIKVYHDRFGNPDSLKSREEMLKAIQDELQKYKVEKTDEIWQRFETQLKGLMSGLGDLIEQKNVSSQTIAGLIQKTATATAFNSPRPLATEIPFLIFDPAKFWSDGQATEIPISLAPPPSNLPPSRSEVRTGDIYILDYSVWPEGRARMDIPQLFQRKEGLRGAPQMGEYVDNLHSGNQLRLYEDVVSGIKPFTGVDPSKIDAETLAIDSGEAGAIRANLFGLARMRYVITKSEDTRFGYTIWPRTERGGMGTNVTREYVRLAIGEAALALLEGTSASAEPVVKKDDDSSFAKQLWREDVTSMTDENLKVLFDAPSNSFLTVAGGSFKISSVLKQKVEEERKRRNLGADAVSFKQSPGDDFVRELNDFPSMSDKNLRLIIQTEAGNFIVAPGRNVRVTQELKERATSESRLRSLLDSMAVALKAFASNPDLKRIVEYGEQLRKSRRDWSQNSDLSKLTSLILALVLYLETKNNPDRRINQNILVRLQELRSEFDSTVLQIGRQNTPQMISLNQFIAQEEQRRSELRATPSAYEAEFWLGNPRLGKAIRVRLSVDSNRKLTVFPTLVFSNGGEKSLDSLKTDLKLGTDFKIGRNPENLQIDDPSVSRQHASFRFEGRPNRPLQLTVKDLGSTNGVFTPEGEKIDNTGRSLPIIYEYSQNVVSLGLGNSNSYAVIYDPNQQVYEIRLQGVEANPEHSSYQLILDEERLLGSNAKKPQDIRILNLNGGQDIAAEHVRIRLRADGVILFESYPNARTSLNGTPILTAGLRFKNATPSNFPIPPADKLLESILKEIPNTKAGINTLNNLIRSRNARRQFEGNRLFQDLIRQRPNFAERYAQTILARAIKILENQLRDAEDQDTNRKAAEVLTRYNQELRTNSVIARLIKRDLTTGTLILLPATLQDINAAITALAKIEKDFKEAQKSFPRINDSNVVKTRELEALLTQYSKRLTSARERIEEIEQQKKIDFQRKVVRQKLDLKALQNKWKNPEAPNREAQFLRGLKQAIRYLQGGAVELDSKNKLADEVFEKDFNDSVRDKNFSLDGLYELKEDEGVAFLSALKLELEPATQPRSEVRAGSQNRQERFPNADAFVRSVLNFLRSQSQEAAVNEKRMRLFAERLFVDDPEIGDLRLDFENFYVDLTAEFNDHFRASELKPAALAAFLNRLFSINPADPFQRDYLIRLLLQNQERVNNEAEITVDFLDRAQSFALLGNEYYKYQSQGNEQMAKLFSRLLQLHQQGVRIPGEREHVKLSSKDFFDVWRKIQRVEKPKRDASKLKELTKLEDELRLRVIRSVKKDLTVRNPLDHTEDIAAYFQTATRHNYQVSINLKNRTTLITKENLPQVLAQLSRQIEPVSLIFRGGKTVFIDELSGKELEEEVIKFLPTIEEDAQDVIGPDTLQPRALDFDPAESLAVVSTAADSKNTARTEVPTLGATAEGVASPASATTSGASDTKAAVSSIDLDPLDLFLEPNDNEGTEIDRWIAGSPTSATDTKLPEGDLAESAIPLDEIDGDIARMNAEAQRLKTAAAEVAEVKAKEEESDFLDLDYEPDDVAAEIDAALKILKDYDEMHGLKKPGEDKRKPQTQEPTKPGKPVPKKPRQISTLIEGSKLSQIEKILKKKLEDVNEQDLIDLNEILLALPPLPDYTPQQKTYNALRNELTKLRGLLKTYVENRTLGVSVQPAGPESKAAKSPTVVKSPEGPSTPEVAEEILVQLKEKGVGAPMLIDREFAEKPYELVGDIEKTVSTLETLLKELDYGSIFDTPISHIFNNPISKAVQTLVELRDKRLAEKPNGEASNLKQAIDHAMQTSDRDALFKILVDIKVALATLKAGIPKGDKGIAARLKLGQLQGSLSDLEKAVEDAIVNREKKEIIAASEFIKENVKERTGDSAHLENLLENISELNLKMQAQATTLRIHGKSPESLPTEEIEFLIIHQTTLTNEANKLIGKLREFEKEFPSRKDDVQTQKKVLREVRIGGEQGADSDRIFLKRMQDIVDIRKGTGRQAALEEATRTADLAKDGLATAEDIPVIEQTEIEQIQKLAERAIQYLQTIQLQRTAPDTARQYINPIASALERVLGDLTVNDLTQLQNKVDDVKNKLEEAQAYFDNNRFNQRLNENVTPAIQAIETLIATQRALAEATAVAVVAEPPAAPLDISTTVPVKTPRTSRRVRQIQRSIRLVAVDLRTSEKNFRVDKPGRQPLAARQALADDLGNLAAQLDRLSVSLISRETGETDTSINEVEQIVNQIREKTKDYPVKELKKFEILANRIDAIVQDVRLIIPVPLPAVVSETSPVSPLSTLDSSFGLTTEAEAILLSLAEEAVQKRAGFWTSILTAFAAVLGGRAKPKTVTVGGPPDDDELEKILARLKLFGESSQPAIASDASPSIIQSSPLDPLVVFRKTQFPVEVYQSRIGDLFYKSLKAERWWKKDVVTGKSIRLESGTGPGGQDTRLGVFHNGELIKDQSLNSQSNESTQADLFKADLVEIQTVDALIHTLEFIAREDNPILQEFFGENFDLNKFINHLNGVRSNLGTLTEEALRDELEVIPETLGFRQRVFNLLLAEKESGRIISADQPTGTGSFETPIIDDRSSTFRTKINDDKFFQDLTNFMEAEEVAPVGKRNAIPQTPLKPGGVEPADATNLPELTDPVETEGVDARSELRDLAPGSAGNVGRVAVQFLPNIEQMIAEAMRRSLDLPEIEKMLTERAQQNLPTVQAELDIFLNQVLKQVASNTTPQDILNYAYSDNLETDVRSFVEKLSPLVIAPEEREALIAEFTAETAERVRNALTGLVVLGIELGFAEALRDISTKGTTSKELQEIFELALKNKNDAYEQLNRFYKTWRKDKKRDDLPADLFQPRDNYPMIMSANLLPNRGDADFESAQKIIQERVKNNSFGLKYDVGTPQGEVAVSLIRLFKGIVSIAVRAGSDQVNPARLADPSLRNNAELILRSGEGQQFIRFKDSPGIQSAVRDQFDIEYVVYQMVLDSEYLLSQAEKDPNSPYPIISKAVWNSMFQFLESLMDVKRSELRTKASA